IGSCAARCARSTISARWAAMMLPMSAVSQRQLACQRSTPRSTGRLCSRARARSYPLRSRKRCIRCIPCGFSTRFSPTQIRFKRLVREQFAMLLIDQQEALAALPSLLPPDAQTRSEAFNVIRQVMAACGEISAEDEKRLSEIGRLFGIGEEGATISFPQNRRKLQRKNGDEKVLHADTLITG